MLLVLLPCGLLSCRCAVVTGHVVFSRLWLKFGQGCSSSKEEAEKRKEKTAPFGVKLMRSQVLYRAAQRRSRSLLTSCVSAIHACVSQIMMICDSAAVSQEPALKLYKKRARLVVVPIPDAVHFLLVNCDTSLENSLPKSLLQTLHATTFLIV